MKCYVCGRDWADDVMFCPECGTKLALHPVETVNAQQSQTTCPPTPEADKPAMHASGQDAYGNETADVAENHRQALSVWGFLGMMLLLCIPAVNIVLLFRWMFSRTSNLNKRNFALALLLFYIIVAAIGITLWVLMPALVQPLWNAAANSLLS